MKPSPEVIRLDKAWLEQKRAHKEAEEMWSMIRWTAFFLIIGIAGLYTILTISFKVM